MSDPTPRTIELTIDSAIQREALLDASEECRYEEPERTSLLTGDEGSETRREVGAEEAAIDSLSGQLSAGLSIVEMDSCIEGDIRATLANEVEELATYLAHATPAEQLEQIDRVAALLPIISALVAGR